MAGGLFYECWTEMWTWITRFGKGFATWLTLHSVLSTRVFCSFNFLEAVKSANVPIFFLLSDRYIQLFFVCVTSNSYPGMPAGAHTMTTKKNSPTLRQTLSVWCSMAPIICHGNCQKGFQKKLASGQRRFSVQKNKPQRQNVRHRVLWTFFVSSVDSGKDEEKENGIWSVVDPKVVASCLLSPCFGFVMYPQSPVEPNSH